MMNIVAKTTPNVSISPIAFKSPFEKTLAIPSMSLTRRVTNFPTGVLSKESEPEVTICLKSFERRSNAYALGYPICQISSPISQDRFKYQEEYNYSKYIYKTIVISICNLYVNSSS